MNQPLPTHDDYQALTPLGGGLARVRFRGRLLGETVTWEATLMTLREYRARHGGTGPLRNFIDITPAQDGRAEVTVGLNVACIDPPTVLKSIVMLRQYKRLSPGRHEYGAAHSVEVSPDMLR